jgi:hypothetical protein
MYIHARPNKGETKKNWNYRDWGDNISKNPMVLDLQKQQSHTKGKKRS